MGKPVFLEQNKFGSSSNSRNGAKPIYILWHTEEGNATADNLAAYCNNPNNQASYHRIIRDKVVNIVPLDRASWSVLSANPYTINYCFAGSRASFTRQQWLARENDIRIACWLAVQDGKRFGIPAKVIAPPYTKTPGISDHKFVTQVLRIGNHTDVGPNFPWDVAAKYVKEYSSPPAPIVLVNQINEVAAKNTWLGKRLTNGENVTPDGKGRWAKFEHGYVYWHPVTGAHAVPMRVFEVWADHGWEDGPLGYPVNAHTDLAEGVVQAFERGVIYRKTGQPGFYVHGEIGKRWAREGFENGPLGWPTSNEYDHNGGKAQDFEHGKLLWNAQGAVRL